MLYKKIHFVGLAIYATLSRSTSGAEYFAYANKSPDGCFGATSSDSCSFFCDKKDWNQDFDCGDAGICNISCDQKKCFELSTIIATNSNQLNVDAGTAQNCYLTTTFHLPEFGSATFNDDNNCDDPYQYITIYAGAKTQDIYINCGGDDGKDQCTSMTINATNAQSLYIDVTNSKLVGADTSNMVNIYCPYSALSGGVNGAPCYINANTLDNVNIHTFHGIPYDLWIDIDDEKNLGNVILTCVDFNSNAAIEGKNIIKLTTKDNDCYNTRSPTTAAPTQSPVPTHKPTQYPTISTQEPTIYPTNIPTIQPSQATAIPTKHPTINPTQYPTISPTKEPSEHPTKYPTETPTKYPTVTPTKDPTQTTEYPTKAPTKDPSVVPTKGPSISPTKLPTESPTFAPTNKASITPTKAPSETTNTPSETTNAPSETEEISTTALKDKFVDGPQADNNEVNLFLVLVFGGLAIIIFGLIACVAIALWFAKRHKEEVAVAMRIASVAQNAQKEAHIDSTPIEANAELHTNIYGVAYNHAANDSVALQEEGNRVAKGDKQIEDDIIDDVNVGNYIVSAHSDDDDSDILNEVNASYSTARDPYNNANNENVDVQNDLNEEQEMELIGDVTIGQF